MQQLTRTLVRGTTFILGLSYWPNGTKYIFTEGLDKVIFKVWDPVSGSILIQKESEFIGGSIRATLTPEETADFEDYGSEKVYKYELIWIKQNGDVEALFYDSNLVVKYRAKEMVV